MTAPLVGMIVGSASDLSHAEKASAILREFEVSFEVGIASAHRTPADVVNYASTAADRGVKCIIAMAGLSAALPGVLAAHTTLPVVGVPISAGPLNGADALCSVAQMPPGVPVATMPIDGAKNAALMAIRIIAAHDDGLAGKLASWMQRAAEDVQSSRSKISEKGLPLVPASVFAQRGER